MATTSAERLARARHIAASGEARRCRQQAGVTLHEIAEDLGVNTMTVWRWENGKRRPRGEAALKYVALIDKLAAYGETAA
jgi:DNA-binding transcriptional regulator YiaG